MQPKHTAYLAWCDNVKNEHDTNCRGYRAFVKDAEVQGHPASDGDGIEGPTETSHVSVSKPPFGLVILSAALQNISSDALFVWIVQRLI